MPWYLYIAEAEKTGNYYVGITTEPARRIEAHNAGKGSVMAKTQGPFTLVYTSPKLPDQSIARRLEIKMKGWPREQKKQLIKGKIEQSLMSFLE